MPRIPDRFAFRYFYLGIATASSYAVAEGSLLFYRWHFRNLLVQLLFYLFLVLFLSFLGSAFLNRRDRRKSAQDVYSYDDAGVYRDRALILPWDSVTRVFFHLETYRDRVPAHSDVAWEPLFGLIHDFSVPELTRKARSALIIFYTRGSARSGLTVESTRFIPSFRSHYRSMRRLAHLENPGIEFELAISRSIQRDDERGEASA